MKNTLSGVRTVTLSGAVRTAADAALRLSLPPWAGRNLDALYAALTDVCAPTAIFLTDSAALPPVLRRVLFDAAAANSRLWIFVRS